MADSSNERVKNLALVGQGGVGKTMLAEAMLHLTGKTTRLGGHAGTKPTLDYDSEEGARGFSISTTIAPVEWNGVRINVLDAPCYPDFVGDAYGALAAAETALFMVDAASGPGTITTRLWFAAEELSLARALFINRLDRSDADWDTALLTAQERFGNRLAPVTIPMGSGDAFAGIIDVVHMRSRHLVDGKPVVGEVPAEFLEAAQAAHAQLTELVVEADDEAMMTYLEGGEISQELLESLLATAIAQRIFVPVFAGSCVKEEGVISLMDDVAAWFPSMADFGRVPLVNGETLDISPDDDRPVAFVFKSLQDQQNGRLSFVKVLAGTLTPGIELMNARTRKTERLGHLYSMCGRETTDVKSVAAGDVCVVPKLEAMTGDTLSVTGKVEAAAFRFPNSLYRIAVEPDERGSEGKVFAFLEKSAAADPTLSVERDEETGQTVISAIGEAQVSVLLDRLEERAGVTAHTVKLRIPYRETIRRVASAQGRHKKQTGGAGQYGDCWLRVEPNPGAGYEFVDEVVGGHIPRNFIPAIDKGVQETMVDGVLAGYPLIDVRVAVYDGSYHPVDSNEMAFKTAARIGFQKAIGQAEPVLLEPMAHMSITVPDSYAGSIMGDVSASRGRVEGMSAASGQGEQGMTTIEATIPYAEVTDYATRLRSLSRGTGEFELEVSGYEQVPHDVQAKLAAEYAERRAEGR
ncbi:MULTISPECIES: elongation factor G [Olsenella]|uniref:elongation factor G n=1 Tax=Olsenella TaxID=133925 RepID=UPI0007836A36|nr:MULTISPECIES: elongation factor G [Olsenella]KXB62044.1 putative translation elongation factor G [Olsenella sp. DNF00959]